MGTNRELMTDRQTAGNLIAGMKDRISKMLPEHMTPERMLQVLNNAVSRNPKLLQCTQTSFCAAITAASEFGLEPNTPLGLCHIIPYGNEATFQMGYPGLVDLAYRSGQVDNIYAEAVHKNDKFSCTLGIHRDIVHEPKWEDRGEEIGYYAVVELKGASPQWAYITKAEAQEHGKQYSKSYNKSSSAWQTAFKSMAMKTALIKALKFAPKSIENKLFISATKSDTDNVYHQQPIDIGSTPEGDAVMNVIADAKEPNGIDEVVAFVEKYKHHECVTMQKFIDAAAKETDKSEDNIDLVYSALKDEMLEVIKLTEGDAK